MDEGSLRSIFVLNALRNSALTSNERELVCELSKEIIPISCRVTYDEKGNMIIIRDECDENDNIIHSKSRSWTLDREMNDTQLGLVVKNMYSTLYST